MGIVNKKKHNEIKVNDFWIPDGFVKIILTTKEDFMDTLEDEGSYFKKGNILIALGENIAFMYEEV